MECGQSERINHEIFTDYTINLRNPWSILLRSLHSAKEIERKKQSYD